MPLVPHRLRRVCVTCVRQTSKTGGARGRDAAFLRPLRPLRCIALASIHRLAYRLLMRLKSSIWVAAYLRRCQTEGVFGAVRRRGAEEAGAGFVKLGGPVGNAGLC